MEYYSPKKKNEILNKTTVKFSINGMADSQDLGKAGKKKKVKATLVTDETSTQAGSKGYHDNQIGRIAATAEGGRRSSLAAPMT